MISSHRQCSQSFRFPSDYLTMLSYEWMIIVGQHKYHTDRLTTTIILRVITTPLLIYTAITLRLILRWDQRMRGCTKLLITWIIGQTTTTLILSILNCQPVCFSRTTIHSILILDLPPSQGFSSWMKFLALAKGELKIKLNAIFYARLLFEQWI